MDSKDVNEIIKTVQTVIGPQLEAIHQNINSLEKASAARYSALERQIGALDCPAHASRINKLETNFIELRGEVRENARRNKEQDASRDKKEGRVWMVLSGLIIAVGAYLIQKFFLK